MGEGAKNPLFVWLTRAYQGHAPVIRQLFDDFHSAHRDQIRNAAEGHTCQGGSAQQKEESGARSARSCGRSRVCSYLHLFDDFPPGKMSVGSVHVKQVRDSIYGGSLPDFPQRMPVNLVQVNVVRDNLVANFGEHQHRLGHNHPVGAISGSQGSKGF